MGRHRSGAARAEAPLRQAATPRNCVAGPVSNVPASLGKGRSSLTTTYSHMGRHRSGAARAEAPLRQAATPRNCVAGPVSNVPASLGKGRSSLTTTYSHMGRHRSGAARAEAPQLAGGTPRCCERTGIVGNGKIEPDDDLLSHGSPPIGRSPSRSTASAGGDAPQLCCGAGVERTGIVGNGKIEPDDDLLSHGETPHYHRRCAVSLLSSGWFQVVPAR